MYVTYEFDTIKHGKVIAKVRSIFKGDINPFFGLDEIIVKGYVSVNGKEVYTGRETVRIESLGIAYYGERMAARAAAERQGSLLLLANAHQKLTGLQFNAQYELPKAEIDRIARVEEEAEKAMRPVSQEELNDRAEYYNQLLAIVFANEDINYFERRKLDKQATRYLNSLEDSFIALAKAHDEDVDKEEAVQVAAYRAKCDALDACEYGKYHKEWFVPFEIAGHEVLVKQGVTVAPFIENNDEFSTVTIKKKAAMYVGNPAVQNVTHWLACDFHDGRLVVDTHFPHWADAYVAALSNGESSIKRGKDGNMVATLPFADNGLRTFASRLTDDNRAKDDIGYAMRREYDRLMHTKPVFREKFGRYMSLRVDIDPEGFVICEGNLFDFLKTAIFGNKAGFKLRPVDQKKIAALLEFGSGA
jgi:hypothetical protein